MSEQLLSTGDAARMLGISAEYLRQLADSGRLPAQRTSGGQRIFKASDIKGFQEGWEARKRTQTAGSDHE